MNQKTIERVPTCGENDVDLRIARSPRRAVDRPASAPSVTTCKTCGGSKVDPGGLPECRDCAPSVDRNSVNSEFTYLGPDGKYMDSGDWRLTNDEAGSYASVPIYRNGKPVALVFSDADDFEREIAENCALLAAPQPVDAAQAVPYSCETCQIDDALANFLAEHTSLNPDGIDTHAMRMTLALNYAALRPTPESDIAEWREQGYLDAAQAVPEALSEKQALVISCMDAWANDAGLPTYTAIYAAAPVAQPTDTTKGA